jgi:hypothetical protein
VIKITKKTTLEELAGIVVGILEKNGISAVLTGGAVVSIYTDNEYQSRDLDFISTHPHSEITKVLTENGFKKSGRIFIHSRTDFTIEFPSGPLAIGDREPIVAEGKKIINGTTVRMLSPTQSVMDRLCWFFLDNDRQCLDQAISICLRQPVSLTEVRKFAQEEKQVSKFGLFANMLKEKRKGK